MEVKINLNQEQAAALLDFLRGMPLSSNTTLESVSESRGLLGSTLPRWCPLKGGEGVDSPRTGAVRTRDLVTPSERLTLDASFDHLVGAGEQRGRYGDTDRLEAARDRGDQVAVDNAGGDKAGDRGGHGSGVEHRAIPHSSCS